MGPRRVYISKASSSLRGGSWIRWFRSQRQEITREEGGGKKEKRGCPREEEGNRGNKVFQEGKWYRYKVVENGKKTRELVNVIAVGIATRRDMHREESELRLVLGRAK